MNIGNIEKNIAIPPNTYGSKYPFRTMEVGDSILISSSEKDFIRMYNNIRSALSYCSRILDRKFTQRKESPSSIRIWRLE